MSVRSPMTLLAVAAVCIFFVFPAGAAEHMKFDATAFATAAKAGKPILIDVTAPWCPTCKAQAPVIEKITAAADYKDMVIYDVDFDTQKDALRRFKATSQSTLIAFKGEQETGRMVGETSPGAIEKLLASAK